MTFVSYAQNFEDVMLWRALKHVAQGFWIDVGAAHPDEYSVTRTFSDQGWRGINIEANPSYAPRIASARPRDVTLAVAAGAGSLPVHFFEVVGTGLSTTDHAIAEQHRAAGFEVREHEVPSRRLASICDEFAPHDIHFLKIDVEGAERDVLAGADFIRHRPWIVLVEATKPLSQEQTHAEWEDLLLAADYRFVWFDGLNRFYIAAERWEELAPAFVVPANVFDDFIRAADAEHLNRIIDAEMRARQAEARIGQAELRAAQAEARAREEEGRAGQAEARAAQAEAQAVQAEASAQQAEAQTRHAEARVKQAVAQAESHAAQEAARAAAAQERADEANVRLAQVYASTSWRTTGPMRAGRRLMQKRVGVALQEAGMPQSRVQRLKRVMGEGGGATKKAGRLAFYLVTRAASRLPGAGTVGQRLERIAPRPWGWLRQRGDAYLAAALQDEVPPPSPEPGRAMVRPAITYTGSTGRRTRIVHQFHSGSAPGDAVTNSLLLMRDWLRGQGYASEIFVQHRHPALEAELLEIDDLPAHDDYALVVHHSMGYDALDRILALPVQKVLMYHNITPSKFLQGLPVYIHYADLGRQQLGIMRPYMVAALADSEFNALELRSAGYDAPVACPFLFDVRRLLTEAAGQRSVSDLFTILFVGRVVPSKGQADLVDAFAAFRAAFGAACRLVLVGKAEADGAPYPTEIHQRIALHGLKDQVILTGAVSDDELHDWYRTADLYVSLSHHEGFGVPLVEAMAHGVPILAWPAGAVPYTLGGAGVLLPERSPEAVGRTMLELARDPDLRAHIASRQADVLEGFQLDRHAPKLMQALLAAGVAPPVDGAVREAVAANLQLTVTGHVNGTYSLASVNRTMALALSARRPGSVRILPWENGPVTALDGVPFDERAPVAALVDAAPSATGPDLLLSQHYPVHVPSDSRDGAFAMIFWEESLLPEGMVATVNAGFKAVLAPSSFVAKALVDSGVCVPILATGYAPHLDAFFRLGEQRSFGPRPAGAPFTFLHVSSCFPRKGVDVLLAAYATQFRTSDPVRLVIKGFPNPHNDVADQIAALRAGDPLMPEIVFINEDLADDALLELYRTADAMVLPARGEGFNMPAAEAMAAGIPLIVTGHGGHLDFCSSEDARFIDYRFALSHSHVASEGSVWLEPDRDDLARAMRDVFDDARQGGVRFLATARHARTMASSRLDAARWADRTCDMILGAVLADAPRATRLAWVSTWDVRCGIAEYSRHLLEGMGADQAVQTTIICDSRTPPSLANRIQIGWSLGNDNAADSLARAIAVQDADVVVIQHQPGLLDWSQLVRLLSDRRVAGRLVVATLHAAVRIMDIREEERTAVLQSLRGVARVIVHKAADLNLLKDLGLTANVTLFPHGAPIRYAAPSARLLSPTDAPTLGCFGFLTPGKGLVRLIEAAAVLRARWPRLRLRLLTALHPFDRGEELARCQAIAASLGMADAIVWETGFLPTEECLQQLSACDLIVLPYEESKESASGAIRIALASGAPVAVTPVAIFAELGDAVYRFSGDAPGVLAQEIDALLKDQALRARHQDGAEAWLAKHGWDVLGRRFKGMLTGLHTEAQQEKYPQSKI